MLLVYVSFVHVFACLHIHGGGDRQGPTGPSGVTPKPRIPTSWKESRNAVLVPLLVQTGKTNSKQDEPTIPPQTGCNPYSRLVEPLCRYNSEKE